MTDKHEQKDVSASGTRTANDNLSTTVAAENRRTPLLDNLSGLFTRRRQGRMGLYLPLVHVDAGD